MANDRTRTFMGKYLSKDGKTHEVAIRVFKRFASLGLAITLTYSIAGKLITAIDEVAIKDTKTEDIDSNLLSIEDIIEKNPNILKDVEKSTYIIKVGDTMSSIAEANSNTVKRLCALNQMSAKQVIYPGQEINIETIKDKTPEEKDISALESYFYDYVFNSPIAKLAKNAENKGASSIYRTFLYGNPKNEYELDPNSIYGKYINRYLSYHNLENPMPEEKKEYINMLTELSKETQENLNLGNTVENLIPYPQYRIFLENGTTKYDELKESCHTIYA